MVMPIANVPGRSDATGRLVVAVEGAGSGGTSMTDKGAFTAGADGFTPIGGVNDDASPSTLSEGEAGTFRSTPNRALHVNLRADDGSEASIGGGTEYTEDVAAPADPIGKASLLVREDARAGSLTTGDGDWVAQRGNDKGEGYVKDTDLGVAVGPTTDAAVSSDSDGSVNAHTRGLVKIVADVWDAVGHYLKVQIQNATLAVTQSGAWTVGLSAGTNNVGDVDVASVPTDPFGANADAASATGSISAKLRFIAATGIPVTALPNVTLAAGTNTNEVVGDGAHGATIAGNPVRVAGRALSSDYTAITAGQTADLITSLLGKLISLPYALPGATWSYAAASGGITNTTGVTAKAAAGAGIRNYVKSASFINGHATTDTDVQIRDGASGTVLYRGFAKAAGGGASLTFEPPLRGSANTLIEIACGTTGSATYINLQGYTAGE